MSVIKVRLQKDFTVLNNAPLQDPRLSFKAKGLWSYCMSRPDNWEFHVTHLATVSKDGVDAIYSALNELMKVGLIEKYQSNNGRFGRLEYIVYPYYQELKKCLPLRDFTDAEFSHAENPALLSTDSLPRTEKEQIHAIPADRSPPPPSSQKKAKDPKTEVAPGVFVTETQKQSLLKKLNNDPDKASACYEKLSNWKIGKGKVGGNDYLAMVNWVIEAVETEGVKPKAINRQATDKELAEKVAAKYPNHRDIEIGYNYIEFKMGMTVNHLKFGDNGFREQLENCLRKMALSL